MITIGLFGTCGSSTWRTPFMERYTKDGIAFFNPQVAEWKPEDAQIEAEHLANDQIVLFPITSETYASGSLAEVGFSILQAIRLNDSRDFVVYIEQKLDDALDNQLARKESLRARALVLQHMKKLKMKNVYLVNNLEEMLQVSLALHLTAKLREPLARFNPQNQ